MKKALVVAMVMVLGLGLFVSAQTWDGTWSAEISFSPAATQLADLLSFSSGLDVTYTVGGWDFGSVTGFSSLGLSSLSFTAVGVMGAFSFDATMAFTPMKLSTQEIEWVGVKADDGTTACLQTPSWVFDSEVTTKGYAPAFDKLSVEASVSIAGINFDGLFFLKGADNANSVTYSTYYFTLFPTQVAKTSGGVATFIPLTTTGTTLYKQPLVVASSTKVGSGSKITISGSFAGATITSYTYFNLEESMYNDEMDGTVYIRDSLKKYGTVSGLACDGCSVFFNEEYILIEGLAPFGDCLTLDAAISFSCCDFEGVDFLFKDISLGLGGISLDFLVSFTTTSKTMTLEPQMTIAAGDCFSIAGAISWDADTTTITGVKINGLSYTHVFNGVTVSFAATWDQTENPLIGTAGTITHDGTTNMHFWVPDTHASTKIDLTPDANLPAITISTGEGDWALWDALCSYEEATVINKLSLEYGADGCCNGTFSFTSDTYFGTIERYTLQGVYGTYYYDTDDDGVYGAGETIDYLGTGYGYLDNPDVIAAADPAPAEAPEATADSAASVCSNCSTDTVSESLKANSYYGDGVAVSTLLGWVETDAELGIAINTGGTFTLTAGFKSAWYGWKSLSLGFKFEF